MQFSSQNIMCNQILPVSIWQHTCLLRCGEIKPRQNWGSQSIAGGESYVVHLLGSGTSELRRRIELFVSRVSRVTLVQAHSDESRGIFSGNA